MINDMAGRSDPNERYVIIVGYSGNLVPRAEPRSASHLTAR